MNEVILILVITSHSDALVLTRVGLEQIDILLTAVEALDINGGESIVWASKFLGYPHSLANRVGIWKLRCCNPMRRPCRRYSLTYIESDALIEILALLANRLYPVLHQLLSSDEPSTINFQRWKFFHIRFTSLLTKRMNLRSLTIQLLIQDRIISKEKRRIITILALTAGKGGVKRLRRILLSNTF